MMLERGIATVTVGFPATVLGWISNKFLIHLILSNIKLNIFLKFYLAGGRVRFCVSAAHTREMLDKVIIFNNLEFYEYLEDNSVYAIK
jgi:hypothetical protein